MQLAAGVQVISAPFWQRPLNLTLFQGRKVALVDSGVVGTPAEFVIPYLRSLGLTPQDLSLILITHNHTDHAGGNEELWLASGRRVQFAAHRLDQARIEDPDGGTRKAFAHWVELGLMTHEALEESIRAAGGGVKLDHVLQGGEVFDLGDGLELEIVFAPGHTEGNICVFDRKHKVLVQGETVAGVAQYDVEGRLLTAPYYIDPEVYLRTIATVARVGFEVLVPAHEPPMGREEAARYLEASLDFVLRLDAEVRSRIQRSDRPLTALELWRGMDRLWGQYPADLTMYGLVESHLKVLVRDGAATGTLAGGLTGHHPHKDSLALAAQDTRQAIAAMRR